MEIKYENKFLNLFKKKEEKKEQEPSLVDLYKSEATRIQKLLAELDPKSEDYKTILGSASVLSNTIAKLEQAKESEAKAKESEASVKAKRLALIADIGTNIGSMGLDCGMKGAAMAFESNGGAFTTFTTKKISSSSIKPLKSKIKV